MLVGEVFLGCILFLSRGSEGFLGWAWGGSTTGSRPGGVLGDPRGGLGGFGEDLWGGSRGGKTPHKVEGYRDRAPAFSFCTPDHQDHHFTPVGSGGRYGPG